MWARPLHRIGGGMDSEKILTNRLCRYFLPDVQLYLYIQLKEWTADWNNFSVNDPHSWDSYLSSHAGERLEKFTWFSYFNLQFKFSCIHEIITIFNTHSCLVMNWSLGVWTFLPPQVHSSIYLSILRLRLIDLIPE